ncbi:Chitinase 5 [Morella rubra]|uniref:chitinase n=1 Tax=Morella rubra TaxID=262757 RepID=A0A6A1W2M0_9ROSI|nr:Chitinase 5 [Morella rubra]
MKRGREFPSVTSGQLHTTSASKRGRGRTRGDHFDLDYTRHEDVRTVVETMMTARRTHRNRMHAYFKKFPSKEAALLKPHPDTTEEQWKELCDLFTSEAFMKRSEQNKKNRSKLTVNHAAGSRSFQRTRACMKNQESGNINPAELYKKNYTNKDGIWTLEGAREIYERMDAFQRKCDLEGKTYTEIEKQAEMEATLRDHREEQRVEQERIRLEQEERMKREQERMRVEHEERMQQEQERMRKEQERLRAEISKELEKKMFSVMEKKMSDMSKRLFSQFGAFCYINEINGASNNYCDASNTQYPCNPSQQYYGRRPLQLTWNYNYGAAESSNGFDGLNSLGTVGTDPIISFKTALWFWMNNVHQVVIQEFGATI